MKKIVLFVSVWLLSHIAYAIPTPPGHATIDFVLMHRDQGESCPALLQNAHIEIAYDYDFKRNMGLAYLKQLQTTRWTEILHPLGLANIYGFMSDMAPKSIQLSGGDVVVYRVIFNLLLNGDSQVRLMLGRDGTCIMSSNVVNVNQ
jgi:hypothetical protein